MSAVPCVRCGDFLEPKKTVVEGIRLCAGCLDPTKVAGEVFAVMPPKRVVLGRLGYGCSWFAIGTVLGVAVGLAIGGLNEPVGAILGGVGGFILAEIAFFIWGFTRQHHLGHAFWKKRILEQFRLAQAPEGSFALAIYSPRFVAFTNMKLPVEVGLLAESESGLVFLGTRAARVSVRFAEVVRVSTKRMHFFPPRTCVRLELEDGDEHWLCWIERPTFGANRKETDALAERIRARIGAAAKPAP